MSVRRRRAGIVGALLAVGAAGAAVAVAAERLAVGRIGIDAGDDAERFGPLPINTEAAVRTADGIDLHVEVVGGEAADLTAVFVHGYCLDLGTWDFQRRGLADLRTPRLRMVFYDQRGHGRSGRAEPSSYTLEQLGRDLETVIEATAPEGPLVLCGHSMGGMTVMALAEQRPDLFADRVVGVALVSTSAGELDTVSFGMPRVVNAVRKPVTPLLVAGMRSRAGWLEHVRRGGSDIAWVATRRWAFGSRHVSPALVDQVERMISGTPVKTIAGFVATLNDHKRFEALRTLDGIETIVIAGDRDLMTPVDHSRKLAEVIPGSLLVEISGGAHLMLMDHADEVNRHLRAFFRRAARTGGKTGGRHRG